MDANAAESIEMINTPQAERLNGRRARQYFRKNLGAGKKYCKARAGGLWKSLQTVRIDSGSFP